MQNSPNPAIGCRVSPSKPMPLRERVLRTIRQHALIPDGGRVVVAVSGGSDSVALVHILHELATDGAFELVGLAHFNHQLRGAAADEDEAFCRKLAAARSLPLDVESADVRTLARTRRTSIENAARQARYAFLERAASRARADRVAVGHTRNDQAETFLLRLVRGAGPRGLAGIYPRVGLIIRPLLDVDRQQLRDYLGRLGTAFREDDTNRDVRIPRNRVRHELMPYLQRHFAPGIVDVLGREATIAREDAEWLDTTTSDAARDVTRVRGESIEINVAGLALLPLALGRRVVYQTLAEAANGRFIGFDHVEIVMQLARSSTEVSGPVDLPGHQARRIGGTIVLTPRDQGRAAGCSESNFFEYPLSIPGEVHVTEVGLTISAQPAEPERPLGRLASRGDSVTIEAATVFGPLAVRSWRPGDRFRPLGLGGRKKLQDFFVDRKIARAKRGLVPLVVDVQGRIIWVVGMALADDFRVTDRTQAVIVLRVRRLGGEAA